MVIAWLVFNLVFPNALARVVGWDVSQAVITILILLPACDLIYRKVELPLAEYGRRLAHSLGTLKTEGRPALQIEPAAATLPISTESCSGSKAA